MSASGGLESSARASFPVLVLEAHERMSIGVIRSLGRAGYPVHACSHLAHAAGLRSSFVRRRAVCPSIEDKRFVAWLRGYSAAEGIRCVIPTEALLLVLRPVWEEFAPLLPLDARASVVSRGINKFQLFEALRHGGGAAADNLPPLLLVRRGEQLPPVTRFAALGTPLFLKVDGAHSESGERSETVRAATAAAAREATAVLLQRFRCVVVQGYVPSLGAGAFLLRWDGRILGRFMHLRLHEIPPRGWSSYRRSWHHADMLAHAIGTLEQLEWNGVAMLEYRWDPGSDRYALIEMNGRFWGSLHLALYAGVDFPALLIDAFRGAEPEPVDGQGADISSRDPILEARYVLARLRDPRLTLGAKLGALSEYLRLSLDPAVKSDLLFPGDRMLALWQCWQTLANLGARFRARGDSERARV